VDEDAKQIPFGESEPGATGLELLLPLALKWSRDVRLPLVQALARVTSEPARILGIDAGHLAVGAPADVCIFDPESWFKVAPENLRSQGKNTPFLGYEVPGVVRYTLVGGEVRYQARG
jgi:dihydroorotase